MSLQTEKKRNSAEKRSAAIKVMRDELNMSYLNSLTKMETDMCEVTKQFSRALQKKWEKENLEPFELRMIDLDKKIAETKKLKGIMSNMSKLIADFRLSSAHLFDGLDGLDEETDVADEEESNEVAEDQAVSAEDVENTPQM